jgi:asparagine synthase (glutamine-hydrolysing)
MSSIEYRLQADVPVGFYLSGGLDSSLVAAIIKSISPETRRHSFSMAFQDEELCESKYQRIMARTVNSIHHEMTFETPLMAQDLTRVVYHCECALKETFNSCALALSAAARQAGVPVVITGQGADELFGGYIGYRFGQSGLQRKPYDEFSAVMENEVRERLWGDASIIYEIDHYAFNDVKAAIYSPALKEMLADFNCLNFALVNKNRIADRHPIHQRSYLDFKLRLADHLLTDHGDRMSMANSVEARHPFLDIALVEFVSHLSPGLKVKGLQEKYALKRLAEGLVPPAIIRREKFGFRSPASPALLRQKNQWVNDLLSPDLIRRQGYFDADTVERLRSRYSNAGADLHPHFETDLLMIVLTFNLLLNLFKLPALN